MPLTEARAIIDTAIAPIDRVENVRVQEANGRVLARDVAAGADVPPFSRAAMDGYAVRAADTTGASRQSPVTLRCVGQTFTGQVSSRSVGPGECIEVALHHRQQVVELVGDAARQLADDLHAL